MRYEPKGTYGNEIETGEDTTVTKAGDETAAPKEDEKTRKIKQQKDPNRGRFLPIPIFITEPAIGDGLGIALAYFHRKKGAPEGKTIAVLPELLRGQTLTQLFMFRTNLLNSTSKAFSVPIIDTDQKIRSYGLGGRYKIFDAQNIWVGIDIARGPEEANWYIQVGHAW